MPPTSPFQTRSSVTDAKGGGWGGRPLRRLRSQRPRAGLPPVPLSPFHVSRLRKASAPNPRGRLGHRPTASVPRTAACLHRSCVGAGPWSGCGDVCAHLRWCILPGLAFLGPGTRGVVSVLGASHSMINFSALLGMSSSRHASARRSSAVSRNSVRLSHLEPSRLVSHSSGAHGSEPLLSICSVTFPWERLGPGGHLAWVCVLRHVCGPHLVVISVQSGSRVLDRWKRGPGAHKPSP